MASLGQLLTNRITIQVEETNLETGSIWLHTGSPMNDDTHVFCWTSPGNGTAIIEAWGAGGTGAISCCCTTTVHANPGAYSKITVAVNSNSYICGCTGCSNASANSTSPSQSGPSAITICHSNGCSCLCVQGGAGGHSFCAGSASSPKCCWVANNWPFYSFGSYCGTVCNLCNCNELCRAQAYGGDVNIVGGVSCVSLLSCFQCCLCRHRHHLATPPGVGSLCGSVISFNSDMSTAYAEANGSIPANYLRAMSTLSRKPSRGGQPHFCWTSARFCGCRDWHVCRTILPYGMPGASGLSCNDSRDHGMRGGMGAIRITFIS